MWKYNYDYLMHSSHKYIDKYKGKSGKYIYVYKDDSAHKRRINDAIENYRSDIIPGFNIKKTNAVYKTISNQGGRRRVGDASLMQPYTNEAQKARNNEVSKAIQGAARYTTSQNAKNAQEAREAEIKKAAKNYNAEDAQNARQNEINKAVKKSDQNKKELEANLHRVGGNEWRANRQAEEEHSSKTQSKDRIAVTANKREAAEKEYATKKEYLEKSMKKFRDMLSSQNVRQQDLEEASKYMESYIDDLEEFMKSSTFKDSRLTYDDAQKIKEDYEKLRGEVWILEQMSGIRRFARPVGEPLPEKYFGKNAYSQRETRRVYR